MALAEMCDTATAYIGQIEIGKRFPSLDMIEKIANALEIKPQLLFADGSETETPKKLLPARKNVIPNSVKNRLVKRLNAAVVKVVDQFS